MTITEKRYRLVDLYTQGANYFMSNAVSAEDVERMYDKMFVDSDGKDNYEIILANLKNRK